MGGTGQAPEKSSAHAHRLDEIIRRRPEHRPQIEETERRQEADRHDEAEILHPARHDPALGGDPDRERDGEHNRAVAEREEHAAPAREA